MPVSSQRQGARPGLTLAGSREMLLPFTVAVCFVLYQLVQLPAVAVGAAATPLLVLYALAPSWARASIASFDRDLVRLLATNRRQALSGRFARALGMRLFAPPALIAERHALVAAELGRVREARGSFRRALAEYGPQAPLRVMLGYAHACYGLADDDEAIRMYERLLKGTGDLPGVKRNLAHSLLRRGEGIERALALLDGPLGGSEDPQRRAELDLLRALAYARLGDTERATELARATDELDSELAQRVRAELDVALAAT